MIAFAKQRQNYSQYSPDLESRETKAFASILAKEESQYSVFALFDRLMHSQLGALLQELGSQVHIKYILTHHLIKHERMHSRI